jgi:K+-sensing histidine kinase KdpD
MQAPASEHLCSGNCAELKEFLLSFAHDLLELLQGPGVTNAQRLLHGLVLCLTGGENVRLSSCIIDHQAISSALRTAANSIRNGAPVECDQTEVTVRMDARQLELALCAMSADASHYGYPAAQVELRCDSTPDEVCFTVSYDGISTAEAELVSVPHLNVKRAHSAYRSDAAISTQTALIAATVNGGRIETTQMQGRQAIRLVLPARPRE